MESFEHLGYFWRPEEPEKKIPGKLSFDYANGAELELLGSFTEGAFGRSSIIHGHITGNYQRVTLSDCRSRVIRSSRNRDINETKWHFERIYMCKKHWFNNIEELAFDSITVSFTHLSDWMLQDNPSSEIVHFSKHSENVYKAAHKGSFILGDIIGVPYDNARIRFWVAEKKHHVGRTYSSINYEFRCTIELQKALHFDEFSPLFEFFLPKFLNVATGYANFPLNIIGNASDLPSEVHICYRIPGYVDRGTSYVVRNMLFTFKDVRDMLANYLAKWISDGEKLWTVYELYSQAYYRKGLEKSAEFMDLARALEVYHRTMYDGEYMSEEEYEPIKSTVIDAIPPDVSADHRDALKAGLKYGYQYSLRTRLRKLLNEILAEQSENIDKIIDNPSSFIHRLVETRNHFTHYDGEPNEYVLRDDELYDFCRRVRMLLQICFLKDMGFPSVEISRLLNNYESYKRFA